MITDAIASLFHRRETRFANATLENPIYSLNDPAAYEYLTGNSQSAAGVTVTHSGSLSLAPVWQALSLISGDVTKLPLYPYKRLKEDDREIDDEHHSYIAASVRWNSLKSAFLGWRDLMVHALLWGNGYAFISKSGNRTELYNLLPDRTAPEWVRVADESMPDGFRFELIYVTEVAGRLKSFLPSQIIHVRGISIDGTAGCDLVAFARDSWGLGLAAQNFASKFFKNGARSGGILELPASMAKPARDSVEEGFRKSYEEGDNPFKTVILREGARFHSAQVTPEQGQVTDMRDTQKREVASYFNIPPSKLGVRDSQSYNSFEQDNLSYLHGCLHHWLATITAECNMKLLSEKQLMSDTHYFEHNVSKFIQADWKTLNEGLEILRRNEVINADEWRRKLNMNRRPDGKGGEYVNPNTRSASAPAKLPDSRAHKDLFANTVNRMARRIGHDARAASKSLSKFHAWIDSGAKEHRTVFDDAVRPVANAYVSVFGGEVETICRMAESEFFGILLPDLAAFIDPPHIYTELQANVEKTMDHFERSVGERIATTITETTDED